MNARPAWFCLPDGGPCRVMVDERLVGLRPLMDEVREQKRRGRPLTILDVGCAEGLIAIRLAKLGAAHVHGIDRDRERIQRAKHLRGSMPCSFEWTRADYYTPPRVYGVVMALSVLHQTVNPSEALHRLVSLRCDRMVVLRLPSGPVVMDRRSGYRPHDLDAVLRGLGFRLAEETQGPGGEWTGFWHAIN